MTARIRMITEIVITISAAAIVSTYTQSDVVSVVMLVMVTLVAANHGTGSTVTAS